MDVVGREGQVIGVATPGSRRLASAGWGLFLPSFFLPAASYSCERAPEPFPLSAEANAAELPQPPVAPAEPESAPPAGDPLRDTHVVPGWQAFASAVRFGGPLGVLSALTNVLLLATVVPAWRRWVQRTRSVAPILAGAAVFNLLIWSWAASGDEDLELRFGYYAWVASFALVAGGLWRRGRPRNSAGQGARA